MLETLKNLIVTKIMFTSVMGGRCAQCLEIIKRKTYIKIYTVNSVHDYKVM
jgi:hypothetical protein